MTKKAVLTAAEVVVEDFDWGQLRWFSSGQLGNSETTTCGQCLLKVGSQNPKHLHPNCEEILHLQRGRIVHSLAGELYEMGPGDTIVIPANVVHNAKNVGPEEAVMTIIFSTPERKMERV